MHTYARAPARTRDLCMTTASSVGCLATGPEKEMSQSDREFLFDANKRKRQKQLLSLVRCPFNGAEIKIAHV